MDLHGRTGPLLHRLVIALLAGCDALTTNEVIVICFHAYLSVGRSGLSQIGFNQVRELFANHGAGGIDVAGYYPSDDL
jgi:hypothetical protein